MNLGGDHLKFEFNKADLSARDRELLSRIAGILVTAHDYTISVNGHTDDVGTDAYNQKLSERRAQAVRDYLVRRRGSRRRSSPSPATASRCPSCAGPRTPRGPRTAGWSSRIANTQIRYGR